MLLSTVTLTHGDGEYVQAPRDETRAWSPGGKQIAFQTDRLGAGFRIAIMNADGSDVRMLTH
jgi:Tol biopolymer transport system component